MALENQVARIPRETYTDFGPTLAMEKLAERYQISSRIPETDVGPLSRVK